MSASRAYIAGVGTTGVLIGFALLTLAVFSAIIAFRGWPGDTAVDGAGAMSVDSGGRLTELDPLRLAKEAAAATATATPASAGRAAGTAAAVESRSEAGGVEGVSGSGTTGPGPEAGRIGSADQPGAPSLPPRPGDGAAPVGVPDSTGGPIDTAGEALGPAGAPAQDGLSQAGQGLSDAVSDAGGTVQQNSGLPSPVVPLPSR
jgi:hypothetical protein